MSVSRRPVAFALSLASLLLSGCAMGNMSGPPTASILPKISGNVHGGQQPVSGATIQLYAASLTADQGVSKALLTTTVLTDSNGNFTIDNDYMCPATNPLVYLVSTGGNPGLGGTVNNADIALMSVLGTCSTLTGNTYVVVNELSTVVSVQALAAFMTDYAHVGAAPTNPTAMAGLFQQATTTYDFSTGQFLNPTNLQIPDLQYTTLANILAACVNTAGGAAGSATPCGSLLSLTGTTTDTVTAALHMIQSPGNNTSLLYALIGSSPPFQPYFTSVPTDFTPVIGFTLPPGQLSAALDFNGHVWIYSSQYSYDTVADASTDIQGAITVYDNNFNQLFTVPGGTGGLYYPTALTADGSGNVYAMNANNTISKFSSTGSALSPSTGWNTGIATTFTGTGPGNGYIDGSHQAGPIVVDALGNIWGDTPFLSANCYFEMNSSGTVITPTGNFCSLAGTSLFGVLATDGSGNAWDESTTTISKVNAAGNFVVSAPTSQSCFYPESNIFGLPNPTQYIDLITLGLRYDHTHNQLWGYSETGAGTITDAGAAGFCDVGPTTLPLIPNYASTSTTAGDPYSAGSLLITSAVLDGAGNLWFTNGGVAQTGVVGSTSGTFTGTVTYSSYLSEINSSGALVTAYNAGSQIYGMQPAGFGVNAAGTSTNASVAPSGSSVALLGVDSLGNIWALDIQTNRVLKLTGLATPNTANY